MGNFIMEIMNNSIVGLTVTIHKASLQALWIHQEINTVKGSDPHDSETTVGN